MLGGGASIGDVIIGHFKNSRAMTTKVKVA